MQYLSDEWILEANKAVQEEQPLDADLVAGYRLDSGFSYAIRFGPDRVSISRDCSQATITFVTTEATATKIALGERSAQRAFLDGELSVEGDINALLGHAKQLTAIQDRLGSLRIRTTFNTD